MRRTTPAPRPTTRELASARRTLRVVEERPVAVVVAQWFLHGPLLPIRPISSRHGLLEVPESTVSEHLSPALAVGTLRAVELTAQSQRSGLDSADLVGTPKVDGCQPPPMLGVLSAPYPNPPQTSLREGRLWKGSQLASGAFRHVRSTPVELPSEDGTSPVGFEQKAWRYRMNVRYVLRNSVRFPADRRGSGKSARRDPSRPSGQIC